MDRTYAGERLCVFTESTHPTEHDDDTGPVRLVVWVDQDRWLFTVDNFEAPFLDGIAAALERLAKRARNDIEKREHQREVDAKVARLLEEGRQQALRMEEMRQLYSPAK